MTSVPKDFLVGLEELHRLLADPGRMDIGTSTLSEIFATGAKRGITLAVSNQLLWPVPEDVLGNLACRLVAKLTNPRCISTIQRSTGLSAQQAAKQSALPRQEILVQYAGHPTPFRCRVDDVLLPPRPSEQFLENLAQQFLSQVTWTEYVPGDQRTTSGPGQEASSKDGLTTDVLKVFVRILECPTETIQERCDALGIDRAQELRARRILEAKGWIRKVELKVGKSVFYRATAKGRQWTEEHNIKVRPDRYKSGIIHQYILTRVEKAIGSLNPAFRLQRNSEIAREHKLQPDSTIHLLDSTRAILEICSSSLRYEARNLLLEAGIEGVDLVIAVTPNARLKGELERAINRQQRSTTESNAAPLVVLDAPTCLDSQFDWRAVLSRASGPHESQEIQDERVH